MSERVIAIVFVNGIKLAIPHTDANELGIVKLFEEGSYIFDGGMGSAIGVNSSNVCFASVADKVEEETKVIHPPSRA